MLCNATLTAGECEVPDASGLLAVGWSTKPRRGQAGHCLHRVAVGGAVEQASETRAGGRRV